MTAWFERLPIHRKLVAMALAVSAVAVLAALAGLIAFDAIRFRDTATGDAEALAAVIAHNASASIVFNDTDAARQILSSVEVRSVVSRACIYRADGTLLAGYDRGATRCDAVPHPAIGWRAVAQIVPVARNDRVVGHVYVERRLSDLPGRIVATTTAGALMLLLAAAVAFSVARRLQVTISRPIVRLAEAARNIGHADGATIPPIDAPPDEVGELVSAFSAMVDRLVSANRAQREANRLKDEFLAAVSHELRTPLNAIMGWTQVLRSVPADPEMLKKGLGSLARNAEAQKRVIEDLLDVSRIITGKLQVELMAVDLRDAIDAAIDAVAPVAAVKSIRLDAQLPSVPCIVQGDRDRLRQILWNLLSNAVKFTPIGGSVSVSVVERPYTFSIVVSDTGPGISPEFLPHVFERFRQADGSTTRRHGGLGLGLALVKELTELHGGTARAANLGAAGGAQLTITLPRLVGSVDDEADESQTPVTNVVRFEGLHVLAVDDDPDHLDILSATLTAAGAQVRRAASGPDALAMVRDIRPDVILCDIGMPLMDGFEVLKQIRADEVVSGRTPSIAVAITAYQSDDYRERCRRAGFAGYLPKPIDPARLSGELSAILLSLAERRA